MHQISEAYSAIKNSGDYECHYRIAVNASTPYFIGEDTLISVDAEYRAMGDEAPGVGYACAATMNAQMLAPAADIPDGAKLTLQCMIQNGTITSEWINKGVFYVEKRTVNRDAAGNVTSIELECIDGMARCESEYEAGSSWTAKTDAALLTDIMTAAGTQSAWTPANGYTIDTAPTDMTGREIIGYLAAMYGGSAAFDDNGQLRLIPLKTGSETSGTGGNITENPGFNEGDTDSDGFGHGVLGSVESERATASGKLKPIGAVLLHRMDGTKFSLNGGGTDAECITLNVDSPWAAQAVCNGIWSNVEWHRYQPFTFTQAIIDPAVEIGDIVSFRGVSERIYEMSIRFGAMITSTISAPDWNEVPHDYQAPTTTGGGGGSCGRSRTNEDGIRFARQQLVADIGDVQSGLYAIAEADDIREFKRANTTLFAKINDDVGKCVKKAYISLEVIQPEGGGEPKSLATILADQIKLFGKVTIEDGGLLVNGTIRCPDNTISCKTIRANNVDFEQATGITFSGSRFIKQQITFANGTFYVIAV